MTSSKRSTQGIALIATILILSMCFASLLGVLSITSLSLKRGGKTHYHGYQALLAAESGINSFTARATNNLFDSSKSEVTLDALNHWLTDNHLNHLTLLTGKNTIENSLRFSRYSPQSVTLESIGVVQSTTDTGETVTLAKKVLKLDFKLYAAGSNLNIQPKAALTTLGDLNIEGNTQLSGATSQNSSGLIRNYDLARANPSPLSKSKHVQLRVQHAQRFHTGDYIALASGQYKVITVDRNASALELLALNSSNIESTNEVIHNSEIALIPLALHAELPATTSKTTVIITNDRKLSSYSVGQDISIAGYAATIESINESTIAIAWESLIPTKPLPEGSVITLGILGARASDEINTTTSNTLSGGQEAHADIKATSLFENTFGLSKDDLLGPVNAYNQRNGKSFSYYISSSLHAFNSLDGLYYTEDDLHFTDSTPLCGNAILIAATDVSVNAICNEGFSGLLYVFGNFSQTAGHIDGAVISEQAYNNLNNTSTATQLTGQASISFSANALNIWQSHLQDALANQDGKQNFQTVAGSWRLE